MVYSKFKIGLIIFFIGVLLSTNIGCNAQFLDSAKKLIQNNVESSNFSSSEASAAIKEALNNGVKNGVELLSQENGYFGNSKIRIPFPEEAKTVESKLRAIGMGDKIDDVVLSLNRAAEDAATEATDLFLLAIKEMTLKDAVRVVKGEEDAATRYLETHTSEELSKKFNPLIKESLDKVDATRYWKDVFDVYNKIPFVTKINSDLTQYATEKAIDGLFIKIAEEEKEIRDNPSARTSALLKKVFK